MADLKSPKLMCLKAVLLLLIGLLAGVLLIFQSPGWMNVGLLLLCIWGFCRAYYFAFYGIEHYIDPRFKFSGLLDFIRHLLKRQ